jgi:uncharacterized phage protein gp47/JayE
MSTNVPSIQWLPTGPLSPQESAILQGRQEDINAAFGGNLNPALNTPQGQLATSDTAIIADKNAALVYLASQMDPDTAADEFQDAIGRIYFMEREPGTPSTVQCLCTGAFNTTINAGAQAQDTSGNFWVCQQTGVIPIGGSVTLPFACTALGPTAIPANVVTIIVTGIAGWDAINNPLAGAVGANVESRAAFEYRRQQSVALNGQGSPPAIGAAVADVANVIDSFVVENFTNATVGIGATNYPVVAHSVYVAAVGGAPSDIARAIFSKKDPGCNMNGNTTVTIQDPNPVYTSNPPSYTYTYNIPTNTAFAFAVQIQNSANLPANIVTLVQNAIVASFTGADGSARARINSTVLAGKFYVAVAGIGPTVNCISILLNIKPGSPTLNNITVGIDQFPTLQPSDVSVSLV